MQGAYKYQFERRGYLGEQSLKRITTLNDEPVAHAGHPELPLIVERLEARLHQFLK